MLEYVRGQRNSMCSGKMRRYMEEHQWQRRLTRAILTLSHESVGTVARLKLKGIDGTPHKQWSMWFNSTLRGKPYQGLTWRIRPWRHGDNTRTQVVHGCRQLVS